MKILRREITANERGLFDPFFVSCVANGAEMTGMCSLEKWYEIVCDATPAGRVDVTKFTLQ